MRKYIFVILLLCLPAWSQTAAVTGKVVDPSTTNQTVNTSVQFELTGCSGNQPRYNGVALLWPVIHRFYTDASGNVSGTVYRSDYITCGTSTASNKWRMTISQNGQTSPPCDVRITSATFDATTPNCLNAQPTVTAPTDTTTWAKLDATNTPFTGNVQARSLEKMYFADQFNTIQLAITAAGTTGAVVIPSSYAGSDAFTNPNGIPVIDLRLGPGAFAGETNVMQYGAKCDGITDDVARFVTAATSGIKYITLPFGRTCAVVGTVGGAIPITTTGQKWNLNGSTVKNIGAAGTILFSATDVDDWAIYGGTIQGVNGGTLGGPTSEALVYAAGGHGWKVFNNSLINSNGWAVKRDPGSGTSPRGEHGVIYGNTGHHVYYGMEFTAGTGSEYVDVVGNQFSTFNFGAAIEAGNITLVANNFVDGVNGIYVGPGTNHAHGVIAHNNINHNSGYNVRFDTVTNGESFIGNHCYADSTSVGRIILTASHGVQILGNFLDCVIQNDSADGSYNFVMNNYMVSATGQTTPIGTSGETNLLMFGNVTNSGWWSRNNGFNVANGGISAGVIPGGSFTAGDMAASRTTTTGTLWLGSDALNYIFRTGNQFQFGGFTSIAPVTANLSSLGTATLPFSAITVTEEITPRANVAVVNGANADVNIGGSTFVKLTGPTGVFSISGFTGGADGRKLVVYNSVAFAWTITNNATSTSANRILTLTGADVTLRAGQSSATFIYDSAQSLWILTGTN